MKEADVVAVSGQFAGRGGAHAGACGYKYCNLHIQSIKANIVVLSHIAATFWFIPKIQGNMVFQTSTSIAYFFQKSTIYSPSIFVRFQQKFLVWNIIIFIVPG